MADPGTKITVYPEEIRLYARGLYLQGFTVNKIQSQVREQFPSARCGYETVKRWRDKENWDQLRNDLLQQADAEQEVDVVTRLRDHQDLYQQVQDRGLSKLAELEPRSLGEAVSVLDTGVKGERTAMQGLVSRELVRKISTILEEEIDDDNLKRRIAVRFRDLGRTEEKL